MILFSVYHKTNGIETLLSATSQELIDADQMVRNPGQNCKRTYLYITEIPDVVQKDVSRAYFGF